MYGYGHYGVAFIVYAPLLALLLALNHPLLAVAGLYTVYQTTRWPDKDIAIPFIKHRGPTHTVWFALLVAAVIAPAFLLVSLVEGFVATPSPGLAVTAGLLTGFLSIIAHLLADVLTHSGIQPFAPLNDTKYSLHVTTADSTFYNSGLFVVGCLSVALAGFAGVAASGFI